MPTKPKPTRASSDLREKLRVWEAAEAKQIAHYRQIWEEPPRCPARKASDPECTCSESSPVVEALDHDEPIEVEAVTIFNSYRDDEDACPLMSRGGRWYLGGRAISFDAVFIVEADGSLTRHA